MKTRDGFALILSLMLILALATLGAGVVALGAREAMIAAEAERIVQARLDVEGAARVVAGSWSTREWLEAGAEGVPQADLHPAPGLDVRALPLRPGMLLLDARTTPAAPGRSPFAAVALLLHVLEPEALLAAFPAAITAENSVRLEAGIVSGLDACLTGSDLPAVHAPALHQGPGASALGPTVPDLAPPMPAPDPLAEPLLSALADLRLGPGSVSPRPRIRDGRCDPGTDNWGALSPASPCHDHLPLILARGPLSLEAGEGRGILVVDGDLELRGDFRFAGIILVRGALSMAGEARVDGLVRADRVAIRGGRVGYDACDAAAAASAPPLDGAFRPPGRWWIPAF